MAIQEAFSNAIVHGCRLDGEKTIHCTVKRNGADMIVTVSDPGRSFDFLHPPDPAHGENLIKFSGRGLHMIRAVVDKVEFENQGATIRLTKSATVECWLVTENFLPFTKSSHH